MPKRYNRCYMTSWIIAFISRLQSRELPTHSYISLKITLKNCKVLVIFNLLTCSGDAETNTEFSPKKEVEECDSLIQVEGCSGRTKDRNVI